MIKTEDKTPIVHDKIINKTVIKRMLKKKYSKNTHK